MKKKAIGAFGIKYEKAPTTLKMAPEAPKDPTAKEARVNVGTTIDTSEDITAELRYIIRNIGAPAIPHNELPKECKTNIFNAKWVKL